MKKEKNKDKIQRIKDQASKEAIQELEEENKDNIKFLNKLKGREFMTKLPKIKAEAFKEAIDELEKEHKDALEDLNRLRGCIIKKKIEVKQYICKQCGTINNLEIEKQKQTK